MWSGMSRAGCVFVLLCLVGCKWGSPTVVQHHAEYKPPPPTKPTDEAPICAHPDEVDATKIIGLQTQLMQIALSCGGQDEYNDFVTKFQPQLFEQRQNLKSFFGRAYGRGREQTALDQYVTQLSDSESGYDLMSGAEFCRLSKASLDKAKALQPTDDLLKFAAQVPTQQSLDVKTCGTPGAPPPTPQAKHLRWRKRTHYHSSAAGGGSD
jgi:hypothetical protein